MNDAPKVTDDTKCEVCGQDLNFPRNGEVLYIQNAETNHVLWYHKTCLDKVGTT
jgi:hypothetical protein